MGAAWERHGKCELAFMWRSVFETGISQMQVWSVTAAPLLSAVCCFVNYMNLLTFHLVKPT
jgi:hypothetical protein